jgi:ABC-2 type transport system permease protein
MMAVLLIAWQDLKRALRDPVGLVMMLAVPLALTVAIGFVADRAPLGPAPADGFDALSYIAPGMALFFMMFSVRQAARNSVEDADKGLHSRLRSAPVRVGGPAAGSVLAQVALFFAQLLALIGVSTFLYGLRWGPPGPLLLACLVLAATAGGWVSLLVAVGRTPGRIGALGTALTLVFAIVSRSFAAVVPSPRWMDSLARVTPNYWGLHAFSALALGGGLASITGDIFSLLLMSAALWGAASLVRGISLPARRTA